MNELTIDGIQLDYPSTWNEFTKQQLIDFAFLLNRGYSQTMLRTIFVFRLLGIQRTRKQPFQFLTRFKKNNHIFNLSDQDIASLVTSLDFMFSTHHNQSFISSQLTINHFPHVGKMVGPSNGCYNLCFLEWHTAELEYSRYNKTLDEKYLNRLIATLYRPASGIKKNAPEYNGDLRQTFNDHLIESFAKSTAKFPTITKYIIYLFYQGSRTNLIHRFDRVFSKADSESVSNDKTPLYLQMVDELNGKDVTKNKEIHYTNVVEVLTRLQREKLKAEELQEHYDKLKSK